MLFDKWGVLFCEREAGLTVFCFTGALTIHL